MSKALLYPLIAQVLWTMLVLVQLGRARVAALQARAVKLSDVALSNDAWPDEARKWSNNFSNQFETPVLFYALCLAGTLVGAQSAWVIVPAWLFVATRIAHTFVHTGSNNVRLRFNIYFVGVLALLVMLIGIALKAL